MTTRALTAAAAITAVLALVGCGSDQAPAPSQTVATSTSSSTPTTTTPRAVPAIVPRALVEDPRHPSTPALRTAARDFFLSYVAYVYGHATAVPGPASEDLASQLRAQGPVPGLEDLHPVIARLLLRDVTPRSATVVALGDGGRARRRWSRPATVVALVDDGRPSGQLQEIPAQLRLIDGRWQATTVAAGEHE
jgi:hypothetical protein